MEVLGGGQAAARDLDARSEAAVRYLVGLSTVDERRAATAVPWPQLLAAVRALAGCQRCGFVPSVVAAFCPELAAALDPPLSTNSRSGGHSSGGGGQGVLNSAPAAELLFPGRSGGSSGTPAGLLAPAQLLALLDNNSAGGGAGGSGSDLVSLLQFAWRGAAGVNGAFAAASAAAGDVTAASDQDVSGAAAHGGRAGGSPRAASEAFGAGSGSGDSDGVGLRRLALNDQLLGKSRLLRRFLSQSLEVMEALSEDVGDCRRHVGYPGPAELASTLSRLELQRAHTLERLAAWGVLRPPKPQAAMAAAATPADAAAGAAAATVGSRGQRQSGRGCGSRVVPAAVGTGEVGGADAGEDGEDVAGDEVEQDTDLELAVAIQLSLQEASAAAAVVVEATPANGDVLEPRVADAQRTPGRGTLGAQGRAPRTPTSGRTRPAAAAATPSVAGTAGLGAGREAEAGGRSPAPAPPASGGRGATSGRPRPLGESVEGLAVYGLADDGQSGDGHPHSRSLGPDPRRLPSAVPATSLTSAQHAARHAVAAMADGHPAMGAPAATASGPLSVSAAAAAAAGLEDAAVLVDTAAVAALPPSLRERVEQLVCQLMQVQQRRTRLQHACQHSIIAAGRKLLLILLQQLWAELLQAADRAAGAAAATVVEEATAAADSRAFAAPAASLEGLAAELAGGVPQRAASATERSGARAAAAAAAAAATGRALGGLAGARSAPSPLPPAVSPSPAGSVGAAVLSVSPGVASTARRQPRYAGRLADLAEGLGDEETHLDLDSLDPDSELNRNLDPAGRGLLGLPAISDLESVLGDVARLREREGRAGRHGGGGAGGVGFGGAGLSGRSFPGGSYGYNNDDDDRRLQLHTWHGRSAADVSGSAGEEEEGEDVVGGGWDDALRVSPSARLRLSSTIGAFGGSSSSGSGSGSAGARDTLSNRLRQSSAPAPDHGATTDLLGSGGRAAAATATTAALLSAALPSIGGHDRAGRRSLSVAFPSSSSAANAGAGAGVAAAATAAVGADSSAGARPPRGAVARRSMAALWESPAGMGLAGGSSSGLGSSSRATATDSNTGAAAAGELDQRHSAPADREARISRILNRSSVASSSCGMLGICSGAGGGGLGGACGTACVAARAEQAEQLQVLQGQLWRCQQSQSELQREVGRLLDQMAGSRRAAEQATVAVRRELAQWQGDAQALQGLGPEVLTELAGRMEAALSRVRAAALAAAAERAHQCPVCWEARKGLVFGCGHQTCVDCGEKLAACPICREPVALRIRVYG